VYRHRDLDHLEELLAAAGPRTIVVTDSVFSMDGDTAPVDDLARLCAGAGALLVLDEAHAVLGPDLHDGHEGLELLRVGTLSKSLGSLGGWVAGSAPLVELLVNRARPYIFTTAPTPADVAAALAALRLLRGDEGARLVAQLRAAIDLVRPGHPSPIVPLVLGDERRAVAASDALLERGFLVPAIRPPTVPVGTSRLRVALSAAHRRDAVRDLVAALDELGLR